jgi:hypothetical protein
MGEQSFRKMGFSKLSNPNLKGSPIINFTTSGAKKDEVESLLREEGMETQRMLQKETEK